MSVQGSGHLGPDDNSAQRERAERQLANVSDLVLFLVGAYLSQIIPQLSATTPLSPFLYDTIMAWATETLEHAGQPQERRAAGEAVPVFDFECLVELVRQDDRLRTDLGIARLMVENAARQLARAKPYTAAWYRAKQVLDAAISRLLATSSRLMEHDDAVRASRTDRIEDVRQSNREAFAFGLDQAIRALDDGVSPDHKLDPLAAEPRSAGEVTRSMLHVSATPDDTYDRLRDDLNRAVEQLGRPSSDDLDPGRGGGGIAPTAPL